ncbi:hypothetical protein BHM03_00004890 [Ensete ventricosum]|uniref:Uncharacterized protein n=1 Tax=Ensete ventricosum TaxID=4639 RepID=A0A445MAU6_ENSVE|nr:hypothetical protein BHM03_00004890 [Ensete ventricosum]
MGGIGIRRTHLLLVDEAGLGAGVGVDEKQRRAVGSSKSPVAPAETGDGAAVRASTCTLFSANAFSKDVFATLVTHVMRIAAQ